jgi:hypothetical protein
VHRGGVDVDGKGTESGTIKMCRRCLGRAEVSPFGMVSSLNFTQFDGDLWAF